MQAQSPERSYDVTTAALVRRNFKVEAAQALYALLAVPEARVRTAAIACEPSGDDADGGGSAGERGLVHVYEGHL